MQSDMPKAFQDFYPEDLSHCYGCGRLNSHGHQLKSHWDGEETVATYTPAEHEIGVPGFVYGGLIASLVDCHGTGSASAAGYRAEGREIGSEPVLRYVTASLHVDYLRPTPHGVALEVRGRIKEVGARKVIVSIDVSAGGEVCAKGEVVAVKIPGTMAK